MIRDLVRRQGGNVLLLLLGAGFLYASLDTLDLGTPRRMGPGFFPMAVAALLVALSSISIITDIFRTATADAPEWLAGVTVVAGVAAFATISPAFGVLPAVFASVFCTSFANRDLTLLGRAVFGLAVAAGVWLVFIVGLRLPFPAIAGF